MEAELVIDLCKTFHKLPSEIMQEDASLLYYLDVVKKGTREATNG